ncbi:DUF6512 family protein [Dorea acetigenes]|jgi:hypothetical protein|uniref:DUF6512 family protein n=1 Tax=Dorea acetigenes TaxID=2981787 RepID=A0ABT2RPF7_9FIRM|nr:DUF6512 family protein [Dorea acetigenes]MCU6687300.1 DUF6512 family protein [Dorea acetigenes]SCJ35817.1 Uncharacterised protein [uncultured Clostridium sp.]
MHKFIRRKDIPYIILTILLGSVFHFLYDFSEQNPFTALFTPINESVWEHLKLLFFPLFFVTIIQYHVIRPMKTAFFGSRLAGAWGGMAFIVIFFYIYTAVLGTDLLLMDLLLFVIGVFLSFYLSARLYRAFWNTSELLILFGWLGSILLFWGFTCFPPDFLLFYPPQK